MNHTELFKALHKDLKSAKITTTQKESSEIASIIFNSLADILVKGQNIEIVNFGSLKLHLRKMRDLSKPDKPSIERWTVSFSAAKKFSNRLNEQFKND